MHTDEMTDLEFAYLQKEIQETMLYLERLQRRHIQQTGRRYVISGPVDIDNHNTLREALHGLHQYPQN
jgi:hypothetical protein